MYFRTISEAVDSFFAMSDSGDSDITWIFYKDRPEWSDVTPVPENDGSKPVVVIAHSEKCKFINVYYMFLSF